MKYISPLSQAQALQSLDKYLNIKHEYTGINCLSLIGKFYENELGIKLSGEKDLFNNFQVNSLKDLKEIHFDRINTLENWVKIDLTQIKEFDILIYTRGIQIAHFSMYVGDQKILDLKERQHSVLRHLNDSTRRNLKGCIRHRELAS